MDAPPLHQRRLHSRRRGTSKFLAGLRIAGDGTCYSIPKHRRASPPAITPFGHPQFQWRAPPGSDMSTPRVLGRNTYNKPPPSGSFGPCRGADWFLGLCAHQFPTSTHTTSLGSPQQFTFPLLPLPLLPPYPSKPIPTANPPTQFIPPNRSCASTMPFFKVCTIPPCCCWYWGWRVPEKTGRRDSAPRALSTVFEAEVHPHNAHDTRCNQVELFCAGKVIPRFAWVPKSA